MGEVGVNQEVRLRQLTTPPQSLHCLICTTDSIDLSVSRGDICACSPGSVTLLEDVVITKHVTYEIDVQSA